MSTDNQRAGFHRISSLMVKMMAAAEAKDKKAMVTLSESFGDDASDFVGMLCAAAGVTEEDIRVHSCTDAQAEDLIKVAGSADSMQKEARTNPPSA
jgi:hypothetical protein